MEFDISRAKNGILLVDKPVGWTSFDVVAKIRGQLKADFKNRGEAPTKRQLKVGHAGTLDPFATGLLIILLGDATRQADSFLKLDKVYEATFRLGETSTTGDPEGEITPSDARQPDESEIKTVLDSFIGEIEQTPPIFSAIKVGGKRAYKLAHQGKEVEIPSRHVTIHSIELLSYSYLDVTIRTHVSSGTYIRSLAEDVGKKLGTGAYCATLRRTRIGEYELPTDSR